MEKCIIYYESWQLQCCGDPFSVGERVEWTCAKPDGSDNRHGITIDFVEEHHGDDTHWVTGTVTKIVAERSESPNNGLPVGYDSVDVIHEELQYADGWESELDDDESTRRVFWGYIVELEDATVIKTRNRRNEEYEDIKEKLPKRIFLGRRKIIMHTK